MNYAELTAPLRELTRRKTKFTWTAKHQEHFEHIRRFTGSSATSLREVALWWELSYSVCWLLKVLVWDEKFSFWTF